MTEVVITRGDDWEGLYIDGVLYYQGHSITAYEVLLALQIPHKSVEVNVDWLEVYGEYPVYFRDVVFGAT